MKKKRLWITGLVIGGALIIGFTAKTIFAQPSYSLYTVRTLEPLMMKGTVLSDQTQQVFYDPSLGKISEVCVKDGQEVKAGTPLVKYANDELQSTILQQQQLLDKGRLQAAQAEENVNLAQQKYQAVENRLAEARRKRNKASDSAEKESLAAEVKQIEEELTAANAEVVQARQAVDVAYSEVGSADELLKLEQGKANVMITAAVDGTVSMDEKGIQSSEVPVVQVLGAAKTIDATVSEYDVDKVAPEQEVKVSVVGSEQPVNGKITSVSSSPIQKNDSSAGNVAYQVKVSGDFPWRNGLTTTVTLPQNEWMVPDQSILEEKGKKYVFLYKNGKVKKTPIELEDKNGRKIVKSGLNVNDKILEMPDASIQDGDEVKVSKND